METILTSSSGSYPRIGRGSVGHALRHAKHQRDESVVGAEEVRRLEDDLAREVICEQESAGLDVVTDGLVRWYCPISHIAGRMEGVETGALHHFLDTNFHVRKAVVKALPQWKESLVAKEWRFAQSHAKRPVKAVLTGPATLMRYTVNESGCADHCIVEAYVEALAEEINALAQAGAILVQIDDPCLLVHKSRWPFYHEAYKRMCCACFNSCSLYVKVYGASCAESLDWLLTLPVDGIGLDCVADPAVFQRLADSVMHESGKVWSLGIVDARNGLVEEPAELARAVEPIGRAAKTTVFLEPSCGLEYIPRRYARAKLEALVATKHLLEGRS